MIKLNAGFSDYSDDDLQHLGETVAANIPTIAVLSTLKPTPADITAGATALKNAIAMVGPGRGQAILAARQTLSELLADVAANAPQISGVTDTDLAEIGLPKAKAPTRATQPPGICGNLRLFHGQNPGEITGRCDPAEGNIRTYEAQWTLDPNGSTWSDVETFPNSRAFKFTGLTRGKDVWVRVRARNAVGAGPWSDPATIMVT
jgi:hypothetical protein